jgi:ATPase subunit of ABC transporter with duplicated ATPase domains
VVSHDIQFLTSVARRIYSLGAGSLNEIHPTVTAR